MAKKETEKTVELLDKLIAEVDPQDAIIIGMGFIAGMYGGTIIDELMKGMSSNSNVSAKQSGNPIFGKIESIKTDPLYAFAISQAFVLTGASPILSLIVTPFIPNSPFMGKSEEAMTVEDKSRTKEYIMLIIAGGCIGAIAAYAITRPGAIEGIGNLVKGLIPSVIPV